MYTVQSKKTVMFPFRSVETETVSISVQLETGETFNETIIEWQLDCSCAYYILYVVGRASMAATATACTNP